MSGGRKFFTVNMVVDTTVWVHLFRKEEKAKDFLLNLKGDILISRITVMEIIYGRKSKTDVSKMWRQFENLGVELIEISEEISEMAGEIFEKHYPTRGIGLLDAFVAATALVRREKLTTHNIKHFRFIKELELVEPY
jgi:hypothetical protein